MQPSRVLCRIGNVGEKPVGLLADPFTSVYKAMMHLMYLVGIPSLCMRKNVLNHSCHVQKEQSCQISGKETDCKQTKSQTSTDFVENMGFESD